MWNSNFAYAVGLITTDGSLSIDGRHINLTSKDTEQLKTFASILNLKNKIGEKKSSYNPNGRYYQIQFGDVKLYRFLLSIGLTPHKTKTLGVLTIPNKYFADFLRGHLDGDGFTYSYWDKRWKSSFMLYTGFTCASLPHLDWIRGKIYELYGIDGQMKDNGRSTYYQLVYAKKASILLLAKMYHNQNVPCLLRKRFKIDRALGIINRNAGMLER
ncbi:MAG: hypothetical protein HY427_01135 [Candidatus Levybacteria bacterium]|nr:hypothetical protein [Candidatus Levybacteria bacterium]